VVEVCGSLPGTADPCGNSGRGPMGWRQECLAGEASPWHNPAAKVNEWRQVLKRQAQVVEGKQLAAETGYLFGLPRSVCSMWTTR